MSVNAYKKTIRATEDPRDIERRVLSNINASLQQHAATFDEAEDPRSSLTQEIREAIWNNQRFWMTVKSDLRSSENQLSPELRAELISIAIYIDTLSAEILAGQAKIAPLVEINDNIIKGLSRQRVAEPSTDG